MNFFRKLILLFQKLFGKKSGSKKPIEKKEKGELPDDIYPLF